MTTPPRPRSGDSFSALPALRSTVMDLEATARQKGIVWQSSADTATAHDFRGPEGCIVVQLNAADASTIQVILRQS
jgi:hypothetical protein